MDPGFLRRIGHQTLGLGRKPIIWQDFHQKLHSSRIRTERTARSLSHRGSPWQRSLWTKTPSDRDPPWTETPWTETPWTEIPPWTEKYLWKHNLCKLRLQAVMKEIGLRGKLRFPSAPLDPPIQINQIFLVIIWPTEFNKVECLWFIDITNF